MTNGISFAQGVSEVLPSAVSQGGTGLTAVGTNQVLVGNSGTFNAANDSYRLVAYATAVSLAASGDQLMTMSNAANLGSYIVRRVTWCQPTVSIGLSTVLATVRTAAAGGGSAITGSLVVTGLTASTAYLDQSVTLASAVTTASQLYINCTLASSGAGSSQLFVYADLLGV